ncbi:helix-turn-helix domain-containing protein [Ruegeria sp.]|uniref:helix-turn-helix domain-containing protein n=1 Tax=Ruegeria sp. TaxID=1879320 RepID=UPI002319D00C|nr:helix-turn-helix domain-containing protein [Ruegeria sp.]MDA7967151.1 helix-turn-helix domain-containing protein [Ruegeria sp.]
MSGPKQDKTKIVQIWGEILDEGFTSVPNILLRYRSKIGLKPKHIMLIIDIMSYKWDAGYPFPSYATLSQRSGVEERSVKRITQDLEELGLLVKTPRFDSETGAQVTTVFDFRPLVTKLIEELNKDNEAPDKTTNITDSNNQKLSTPKKKVNKNSIVGDDRNVMGEGDKNVTRGVTELALGGVTKMSPKEYTSNNKIISKRTPVQNSSYNKTKNGSQKSNKKNRVSKDFRDAIFRNRIFEIYDNLHDLKPTKELVEEGIQRACKDLIVNRAKDFEKSGIDIDIKTLIKKVKKEFPYNDIPDDQKRARNFYTSTICNLVSESASDLFIDKH